MSRSGNYYARNRRDTKPINQQARRPRTRPGPGTRRRIRARSTPGQTACWPTAATSRPRGPHTARRWPTTRLGTGADDPHTRRRVNRAARKRPAPVGPTKIFRADVAPPELYNRNRTMTTRSATMATAISNRMRQIRDRSHPATRARSARRVASQIYATATVVYLDSQSFTVTFPDQSLLVVRPPAPPSPAAAPRPTL